MGNILDKIIECKRREIAALPQYTGSKADLSVSHKVVSMKQALIGSPTGIIAEFKRRSPSKGEIHPMAQVGEIVSSYEEAGAAACSVLTDTAFFGGALMDLAVARHSCSLPLLRKDFIVSRRQIADARACGADAVLLIAAALSRSEVEDFTGYAHSLGLEVLFEIHNAAELDRFIPAVDMVGVNNRDLTTFVTDPMLSAQVAAALPENVVKVAESGLTSIDEVRRLRDAGYSGFLIGEIFMKTPCPGETLKNFINGKL